MRLIDDHKIEARGKVGELLKTAPNPESLETANAREPLWHSVFVEPLQHLIEPRPVEFNHLVVEALPHLRSPFRNKH